MVASRARSANRFRHDLFDGLVAALEAPDDTPARDALEKLRAALSDAEIVDVYIPAAAREMGERWCADTASFADVTIALARLQGLLKRIRPADAARADAPTVLIVVPRDTYHTLGADIVAHQVRRLGAAARIALDFDRRDLASLLETHDFDAVFISAASDQRLERIRALVEAVRQTSATPTPVVLGGSVLEQQTEIKALTGVDHLTTNVKEALQLCGLTIPNTDDAYTQAKG
ncbi:MAG: cobalamin B12-binding domain-containing protein [Shimia sp.]